MSEKTVYLVRHCEAEHNVGRRYHIADPPLTAIGQGQARELARTLPEGIRDHAELVVSSPMRRALETTLHGLKPVVERLGQKNVVLLPHAQECNSYPCDTGSPTEVLMQDRRFDGFDFLPLVRTPEWTSSKGFWSDDPVCLHARAKYVRRWLRSQPEKRIVLVSHGTFLRYLVSRAKTNDCFANGEVRSYTFASEDDEDARLVLLKKHARIGEVMPISDIGGDAAAKL